MLDRPGHRVDSGPRYAGGPGPNARSRQRNPGTRRRGAGPPGPGDAGARGREAGDRGRAAGAAGPSRGRPGPPAGPQRWWGSRPGRLGIALVIGGALAGLLGTVVTGSEPGLILGIFLLAGTAAGALAVHPRAAYLIIPVPALAYLAAAILAGVIRDHAADTSHTALAISAAQWIASGFVAMSAATLLAIGVTVVRWAALRRRGWAQRRPLPR
jgi:hypothetical protein